MIVLCHVMREQQAGVYVRCRGPHGPGELEQGGHHPRPDPGAKAHESWPGQVSLSQHPGLVKTGPLLPARQCLCHIGMGLGGPN